MDYEIVIPTTHKDYNKLPYLAKSIKEYLYPKPKHVWIVYPGWDKLDLLDLPSRYTYINEKMVFDQPSDLAKGFRRPQWIYQQFIKLFQDITKTKLYLVLDSDLILNKNINLFDVNGNPYFFLGNDQCHKPYFNYTQDMFGFGREYNYSFISEIMMFDKTIIDDLLGEFFHHKTHNKLQEQELLEHKQDLINSLYYMTCEYANDNWIPGDYEIYGNFVEKYHKKLYNKIKINSNLSGKYGEWTNEEIESHINKMRISNYDMYTLHTWI